MPGTSLLGGAVCAATVAQVLAVRLAAMARIEDGLRAALGMG